MRLAQRASSLLPALALLSAALWAILFVLSRFGPLNPDEIFFGHVLWMLREGERQYIDFYSNHLPTFFHLWLPFIRGGERTDVSFLLAVKPLGMVVAAIYVWELHRRRVSLIIFGPLLVLFLLYARMLELRTDTVGLLLFNLGVSTLLARYERSRIVLGAFVASLSLLFSARAAVMMAALALALGAATWQKRDYRTLGLIGLVAGGEALWFLALWLSGPDHVVRIIQHVFLDPIVIMPTVTLRERFLLPETLSLVLPVAAAGLASLFTARRVKPYPALVISLLCVGQLGLILLDPAPFGYVYGWAALPAIIGLSRAARISERWRAPILLYGLALGSLVVGGGTAYLLVKKHNPPTYSWARLLPDPVWRPADVERLPTARLIELMISVEGQHNFRNQLVLRSELCKRMSGNVLAIFPSHPICMRDAAHEWAGITWPDMQTEHWAPGHAAFAEAIHRNRPQLVVWADQYSPRTLGRAASEAMSRLRIGRGYAVRTANDEAESAR